MPLDSDDEFRSPEGFINDKLIGNMPIEDMTELASYIERFSIFCKSIPQRRICEGL